MVDKVKRNLLIIYFPVYSTLHLKVCYSKSANNECMLTYMYVCFTYHTNIQYNSIQRYVYEVHLLFNLYLFFIIICIFPSFGFLHLNELQKYIDNFSVYNQFLG